MIVAQQITVDQGWKVDPAVLPELTAPRGPVLLRGNQQRSQPMTCIATWRQPFGGDADSRDVVAYSGGHPAGSNETVCATYGYEAGGH